MILRRLIPIGWRLAICGLILAMVFLLAYRWRVAGEPAYKGKRLGYWIDPAMIDGRESPQEVTAALSAMRDQAIPYLVNKLHWKPARMMKQLYNRFPNFSPIYQYMHGGADPRGYAAHALGQMGPMARKAVLELETLRDAPDDTPSSWYARMCAKAALIKIKQESIVPYLEQLRDKTDLTAWYQNALLLGEFGTNADAAVPCLIEALGPTNHQVIQSHACSALFRIHSRPEVCVPALTPLLKSPILAVRQNALNALSSFRQAAKPAWNDIVKCLEDPDPWMRQLASKTLRVIDPEAAKKIGIN